MSMKDVPIPESDTVLGPRVPRRGNAFSRALGRLLLRAIGWRVVGDPPDAPRFIVAAAPHTSNMDGLIFLIAVFAMGLDLHWIGKHTLFRGPWGPLLRWMGGIGIDRRRSGGLVQQVVDQFAARPQLVLVIAPEGTRSRTQQWKSGFYRMAEQAQVSIALGFMDYRLKRVGFGPALTATGDFGGDLQRMVAFYGRVTPRKPERFSAPAGSE
ncbi:lysophospholipid acyltransferase family protein [Fontimonas sp. SYSU GA230001]|uniref:lysophospholipid acyltransferase family protein n=1 Tax=Fontimonas sp. SYSU GA230001 TaxID=3142450 RepID=UPI0032B54A13